MKKNLYLFICIMCVVCIGCTNTNSYKPVVYLMGDSTCAQKLPEKRPETGWGEKIANFFSKDITFENHAKNGRSTRTFIEEGRWDSIHTKLQTGDYVFIQFGHNDASVLKEDRYTSPMDFEKNLSMFVGKIKEKGARPVLLTPVCRRRFDSLQNFRDSHGEYANITRKVATETGTVLIDAHLLTMNLLVALGSEESRQLFLQCAPGECTNYSAGIEDNTHFNDYGANIVAKIIAEEIKKTELAIR